MCRGRERLVGEALGEYEEHRLKGERGGEDKRAKGKRRPKRTANKSKEKTKKRKSTERQQFANTG